MAHLNGGEASKGKLTSTKGLVSTQKKKGVTGGT